MKKMITDHFSYDELACKCCGLLNISLRALEALENLREMWAKPLVINSACRCYGHNQAILGATHSEHLATRPGEKPEKQSTAFDIKISSHDEAEDLKELAIKCGFKGFGLAKSFLHIDCRNSSKPVTWVYLNK
jgi:zinc D-Ala-D-Ala carboxypeptidase